MNKLEQNNNGLLEHNKVLELNNEKSQLEMKKIIDSIKEEYKESIKENQKLIDKNNEIIKENKKLIQKFSTFNVSDIGKIIAKLISAVELEKFEYIKAKHETYRFQTGPYGNDAFKTIKECSLVVLNDDKIKYYRDSDQNNNEIFDLCRKRKAYLLNESDKVNNEITLPASGQYSVNCINYVAEFINYVIDYKINNDIEIITYEQLDILLKKFLYKKRKLVLENKKRKLLKEQEELEKYEKEKKEKEELLKPRIIPDSKMSERIKGDLLKNEDFNKIINNIKFNIIDNTSSEEKLLSIKKIEPIVDTNMIYVSKCNIKSEVVIFDWDYGDSLYTISTDLIMAIIDISDDKSKSFRYFSGLYKQLGNLKGNYYEHLVNNYIVLIYSPDKFDIHIDYSKSYLERKTRKIDNINTIISDEEINEIFKYSINIERECNIPKILSKKY